MHVVIDSNIIFSALISGDWRYIELVKKIHFYLPDFALMELEKYEEVILNKRKLPISDFRTFVKNLFEEISVIPKFAIRKASYDKALALCNDVDPKDTPFVALAIEYSFPLWTNDQELIKGLKAKGFDNFIDRQEIMKNLE